MANDRTDRGYISLKDLRPFEEAIKAAKSKRQVADKAPAEFGDLECLIGFNKKGEGFLFTREDNRLEEGERVGPDQVWRGVNMALVLGSEEFTHIRVRTIQDKNVIKQEIQETYCFGVVECEGKHTVNIPIQYRSAKARIDSALAEQRITPDQLAEVEKLREQGEALNNDGEYEEALKIAARAQAILGIE